MTNTKHTATPWWSEKIYDKACIVSSKPYSTLAEVYRPEDSTFIVHAVNSHGALVEALMTVLADDGEAILPSTKEAIEEALKLATE